MRGKKGEMHGDPADPPRRRANRRRGHGTYADDRPPVLGIVGRESGQVRLRVLVHTDGETLRTHAHQFTWAAIRISKDEWVGYNSVERAEDIAAHERNDWARDDDGVGHEPMRAPVRPRINVTQPHLVSN